MSTVIKFFKKHKTELIWAIGTLIAGGISAWITGGYDLYKTAEKPPLSPPGWIFPVAWSILYFLMGYAAGIVTKSKDLMKEFSIKLYLIQLLINLIWPIIFFKFEAVKLALVWLALLIVAVIFTYLNFKKIDRIAGILLLPYIAWCIFAFYLNFGIVALN